jgi:septal ring factor EnvC (AmiA/AmiB activator)
MNWEKKFTRAIGSKTSVILHTIFFISMFLMGFAGVDFDTILLILTTVVSLEAISLAIFIQMTVNKNTESLHEVEEDIGEIQEDVDELQEDVDEIQQDVDEISTDIGEIESDIEEMHVEVSTDASKGDDLDHIKKMLEQLIQEVDRLKNQGR